jgi:hypothetical protein
VDDEPIADGLLTRGGPMSPEGTRVACARGRIVPVANRVVGWTVFFVGFLSLVLTLIAAPFFWELSAHALGIAVVVVGGVVTTTLVWSSARLLRRNQDYWTRGYVEVE